MNSFLLILTLAARLGSSGISAIDHMEIQTEELCHKVGSDWVNTLNKGGTYGGKVFYQCVEIRNKSVLYIK